MPAVAHSFLIFIFGLLNRGRHRERPHPLVIGDFLRVGEQPGLERRAHPVGIKRIIPRIPGRPVAQPKLADRFRFHVYSGIGNQL